MPIFRGVGFVFKAIYNIAFVWWLDPWLQRRANQALLEDIHRNLYFLYSQAKVVESIPSRIRSFECASVKLAWENVLFTITEWHGEINVSVGPRSALTDSYELGPVIAALERRHFSERDVFVDMAGAATLLRPRLDALNAAFSEQEYPRVRGRL